MRQMITDRSNMTKRVPTFLAAILVSSQIASYAQSSGNLPGQPINQPGSGAANPGYPGMPAGLPSAMPVTIQGNISQAAAAAALPNPLTDAVPNQAPGQYLPGNPAGNAVPGGSINFTGTAAGQGANAGASLNEGFAGLRKLVSPMLHADTPGAIAAPPLSFVDINSGRFGKLEIDLQDGQFMAGAADNLHLIARNMDLTQGELKSLDIEVKGAHLQDFIVDRMTFSTQGALTFDTGLLFNQKMLQFNSPAQAQVTAMISQESLNKFIKAPTTLDRLSVTAGKTGGMIASLLGQQGGNFGLSLSNAAIVLGRSNHISINADGKLGGLQMAVPLSAEVDSQLFIKDGWVQVGDTKLKTGGQEISPQLSELLVKKINNLSNLGHRSNDIQFAFTDLKVNPGRGLVVTGTAQINRLRFGRPG